MLYTNPNTIGRSFSIWDHLDFLGFGALPDFVTFLNVLAYLGFLDFPDVGFLDFPDFGALPDFVTFLDVLASPDFLGFPVVLCFPAFPGFPDFPDYPFYPFYPFYPSNHPLLPLMH